MPVSVRVNIGRQRITNNALPHEAKYITNIQAQMKLIRQNLKAVVNGIEHVTPAGLKYALKEIYNKSQLYVPVKTGRLKRSGFLEARRTSRGTTVAIGYGRGGRPQYTPLVHEITHLKHKSPTRSKFLEAAVNEHIHNVQPRLVEYIRTRIGLKR